MLDFAPIFDGVEDDRTGNATRHNLHEMLMIALPCVICGGPTCTDMEPFGRSKEQFLRRFMTLEHGIPSHDAFTALFRVDGKSHEITAKGGACVLALKGNQETLHDDVRLHMADPENAEKDDSFQ